MIYNMLKKNCNKLLMHTKKFMETVQIKTKSYETLRYFMPFPNVKTLEKREEYQMDKIKNQIDIDGDTNSMLSLILSDLMIPSIAVKIKCLISIGAIKISLFKKSSFIIKNLIIFQLIPLEKLVKPFCVHKVLQHKNGKVNAETLKIIKAKVGEILSEKAPISLQYISTDGDSGYNPEYKKVFKHLHLLFNIDGIANSFDYIKTLKSEYKNDGLCNKNEKRDCLDR